MFWKLKHIELKSSCLTPTKLKLCFAKIYKITSMDSEQMCRKKYTMWQMCKQPIKPRRLFCSSLKIMKFHWYRMVTSWMYVNRSYSKPYIMWISVRTVREILFWMLMNNWSTDTSKLINFIWILIKITNSIKFITMEHEDRSGVFQTPFLLGPILHLGLPLTTSFLGHRSIHYTSESRKNK